MMSEIASVLGQPMLASDQVVVRHANGTATTIGNIYQVTCAVTSGIPQNFPLPPP
jgi:hypothetical protein